MGNYLPVPSLHVWRHLCAMPYTGLGPSGLYSTSLFTMYNYKITTQLTPEVDTTDGRNATQRDFNKLEKCQLNKVQQGQVQHVTTGSRRYQIRIQTGRRTHWERPCREGFRSTGRQKAGHEPIVCSCSLES